MNDVPSPRQPRGSGAGVFRLFDAIGAHRSPQRKAQERDRARQRAVVGIVLPAYWLLNLRLGLPVGPPLWFVLAVEWFGRARRDPSKPSPLLGAVRDVVDAYRTGTSFGIGAGDDLLLAGGIPGRAITWMDAVVDGEPVTPRIGRAVETNALWHAALKASARIDVDRSIASMMS